MAPRSIVQGPKVSSADEVVIASKENQITKPRWPKLADLMDASEHDVLAYMSFPRQHRTKLHSTNVLTQ